MKKFFLGFIAYGIIPILVVLCASVYIFFQIKNDENNNIKHIIIQFVTWFAAGGIFTIISYFTFLKKFYNCLINKYYIGWDILKRKNYDKLKEKLEVFWVDDEHKELGNLKEGLKKIFKRKNVEIKYKIPPNLDSLKDYHILILDVQGVRYTTSKSISDKDLSNKEDLKEIVSYVYSQNPFGLICILSSGSVDQEVLLDNKIKYLNKRELGVLDFIEEEIKNMSKPKWFWENKVKPYLETKLKQDSNNDKIKKIKKIEKAYIKDWHLCVNNQSGIEHKKEDLELYELDKEYDLNLFNLCNYIIL